MVVAVEIPGVSYVDIRGKIAFFEKAVLSVMRSILSRINAKEGLFANYIRQLATKIIEKIEGPQPQTNVVEQSQTVDTSQQSFMQEANNIDTVVSTPQAVEVSSAPTIDVELPSNGITKPEFSAIEQVKDAEMVPLPVMDQSVQTVIEPIKLAPTVEDSVQKVENKTKVIGKVLYKLHRTVRAPGELVKFFKNAPMGIDKPIGHEVEQPKEEYHTIVNASADEAKERLVNQLLEMRQKKEAVVEQPKEELPIETAVSMEQPKVEYHTEVNASADEAKERLIIQLSEMRQKQEAVVEQPKVENHTEVNASAEEAEKRLIIQLSEMRQKKEAVVEQPKEELPTEAIVPVKVNDASNKEEISAIGPQPIDLDRVIGSLENLKMQNDSLSSENSNLKGTVSSLTEEVVSLKDTAAEERTEKEKYKMKAVMVESEKDEVVTKSEAEKQTLVAQNQALLSENSQLKEASNLVDFYKAKADKLEAERLETLERLSAIAGISNKPSMKNVA